MSDDKSDKSKVTDKASEIARNIWLAGVGAYGRAVDEAQDRMEKAGMETPKLFRELVKAGAALEDEARKGLSNSRAARTSVEQRISRVRENFHLQLPARGEDLLALHEKIDRLTLKVDELGAALAAQGGRSRKPATKRKAPARKTAAGTGRGGSGSRKQV
ncbi:phasin family protein [Kineobactrum salinum]|uniref:Phasin family protein n=1 Tax=Kineobactrum salinum TaxID=2708301 RepID=A0A6C0TZH8_9GAMM|nr:phasin family protein [Kineobactrum salinum]QIB65230.1 phasin family protein [Kineobactrum salinum]